MNAKQKKAIATANKQVSYVNPFSTLYTVTTTAKWLTARRLGGMAGNEDEAIIISAMYKIAIALKAMGKTEDEAVAAARKHFGTVFWENVVIELTKEA